MHSRYLIYFYKIINTKEGISVYAFCSVFSDISCSSVSISSIFVWLLTSVTVSVSETTCFGIHSSLAHRRNNITAICPHNICSAWYNTIGTITKLCTELLKPALHITPISGAPILTLFAGAQKHIAMVSLFENLENICCKIDDLGCMGGRAIRIEKRVKKM